MFLWLSDERNCKGQASNSEDSRRKVKGKQLKNTATNKKNNDSKL